MGWAHMLSNHAISALDIGECMIQDKCLAMGTSQHLFAHCEGS